VTAVLLIRHGRCDPVGHSIAGRAPGVRLNREGCLQAERLADVLGTLDFAAVYSSPLERALETAEPLARRRGLAVEELAELNELDFGDWTGRTLAELAGDSTWDDWNRARDSTRIPGGESMLEAVARADRGINAMRKRHPGGLVLAVTHGDVIRGLLCHVLGVSLNWIHRLEVSPGSVSLLRYEGEAPTVLVVNWEPASVPCSLREYDERGSGGGGEIAR
jgi:probable phosphoglycerate mutase